MSNITRDLPRLSEKVQCQHPFFGAQPRLARKVVQVGDQSVHEVLETRILGLVVDADRIGRDVVNGQV